MNTYLDCIPCFFKQGLYSARLSGADESKQKKVLDVIAGIIPKLPLEASPPEIALLIHDLINNEISIDDPYQEIKKRSNIEALRLYPLFEEKAAASSDPLLTAVELAIAGNLIDYGARTDLDLLKELEMIMQREESAIHDQEPRLFSLDAFKNALTGAKSLVVIGDNAGEIVFDKLLLQIIKEQYPLIEMIYGVRDKPIINDVTMEDAQFTGIDSYAKILSTGNTAPGAVLSRCTPLFRELFREADVIISKGQGNFEALSEEGASTKGKLFFMLSVKCPVIAAEVFGKTGDVVLLAGN